MRLELGSEVIDSLVTFAIHPIPEADPGKVAEWLNVFTSLLSDIFLADKKKNQSTGFTPTGICGCVGWGCGFGLLTRAITSLLL